MPIKLKKLTWSMFFLAILLVCLLASAILSGQQDKIIGFDHLRHLKRGVACTGCHITVTESSEAADNNLPRMGMCLVCHNGEKIPDECSLCHLNPDEAAPFPNPPRGIVFSHGAHAGRDIGCQTCHVLKKKGRLMGLPSMEKCASCHNGIDAAKECNECHAATEGLRPKSHNASWKTNHKVASRTGENCAICHEESFCQECHMGGVVFRAKRVEKDISGLLKPPLESGGHALKKTHEMNYRYTHPIDAVGRTRECIICHFQRDFCQGCHVKEGVFGRTRLAPKPAWHGGGDWGIQGGYGSGGGRHAQLAMTNAERCVSCHETGDFPTDAACLKCHTDKRAGRGNDLRVHGREVAENLCKEEWHTRNSSDVLCYLCHDYARRNLSDGFCKYCHGKD
ncbi:MAG: cytochrome c3 family protein [Candidatus Eisenbacteria bacterium]|nr:cytochrome c3 family protein [Candidatus Eisenbacteria bacterium]